MISLHPHQQDKKPTVAEAHAKGFKEGWEACRKHYFPPEINAMLRHYESLDLDGEEEYE